MDAVLANYEYEFDGWHWEYRLYLDRLEAEGAKGAQASLQVFELAYFAELPNRSRFEVPTYRQAPAVVGAALVVIAVVAGIIALAIAEPQLVDVWKGLFVLGGFLTLGTYKAIRSATARKDWVTRADFRRIDGTEIFSVWEINDTELEAFDTFLRKIQALIQSSRPAPRDAATGADV